MHPGLDFLLLTRSKSHWRTSCWITTSHWQVKKIRYPLGDSICYSWHESPLVVSKEDLLEVSKKCIEICSDQLTILFPRSVSLPAVCNELQQAPARAILFYPSLSPRLKTENAITASANERNRHIQGSGSGRTLGTVFVSVSTDTVSQD